MSVTMKAVDPILAELEQEAHATEKLLERVPADKLTWKPHPKSMSLGQLALHVAGMYNISSFVEMDGLDVSGVTFEADQPESKAAIMDAFANSLETVRQRLGGVDDTTAAQPWQLHKSGAEIFTIPKLAVLRSFMLNHLYHHRGQLTVYLRMLDVPLPVTYGRTADENPFG